MRNLVVILFLSTSCSLRAQINAGNTDDNTFHVFEGGIVAGFVMSQVHGDYLGGFNKLGFTGGPELHINFTESWFASLEMMFIQKGSGSTPTNNFNGNVFKLTMNYVEVPVLINYNDKNRLIFQGGFSYGRLFKVKEVENGYDDGDNSRFFNDELSYIVGGTFLVGEQKHIGINFRYEGSILSVGDPYDIRAVGLANILLSLRGIYYF